MRAKIRDTANFVVRLFEAESVPDHSFSFTLQAYTAFWAGTWMRPETNVMEDRFGTVDRNFVFPGAIERVFACHDIVEFLAILTNNCRRELGHPGVSTTRDFSLVAARSATEAVERTHSVPLRARF